ncbi:trimeric intracellular cation channel family protein [Nocardioides sp. GY 10113]|uniref:trimeric intracellular cation channel family protein n=1 Tax=Nocardioides sp. GY 10113 TaxID=2569761 RepID=UPI0010A83CC7|nr:trimeric intracellular cation channel family protein [Nocardioides sp. GY 10113]TIC81290.1 trimeric intracellular cation channel family protein [Nocardioides sp. GY 10113]
MVLTLDLVGIFVFAISGGLVAVRNHLDIVGVVVLAMATGLGGGLIRDVLIGDVPPPALVDWRYLAVPATAGLVTFWWHPAVGRFERQVNVFDAAGLGLFCASGALKAEEFGLPLAASAALGLMTGIGGGVIRDVLAGRVPVVLRNTELYAIPALAGATVAAVGVELGVRPLVIMWPAIALTTGWRLIALRRNWTAPAPRLGPPR